MRESFKKPGAVSPEKRFVRGVLGHQWSHCSTIEPQAEHSLEVRKAE